MIRKININDIESFNKLGLLVNNNFNKLFKLDNLLKNDYTYIYVYEEDTIIGFIHVDKSYETADLINMAVDNNYQHTGIGTKLINYVFKELDTEKLILEVNEQNINAINFYKKNNFNIINVRKKYYGNNDALIMERNR